MTLTPEERHEYIFTYYLWKFDGRQAVYHALSIDDVRLWSPLTNTWVPASKGHELAADPDRDPGCPGGAGERPDERRGVGRLARVEVVKRRGP